MSDRSWMLNPHAIRCAKECISIVKDELGVKLTLSNPDFMHLLHEYVDLTDSSELAEAYSHLLSYAGVGQTLRNLPGKQQQSPKVVEFKQARAVGEDISHADDTIEYRGKTYARWRDGKEFAGLYRGQPRYS